eukprot:Gb_20786 [translate_table: standard]
MIVKVSGLPLEGAVILREKTSQDEQLTKFLTDEETFCWLQSSIARESLPKPWDKVAIQVMKYLTLEGKFRKIFGYHVAILNSIRNDEKVNIPLFLFKSLEKSIKAVKAARGKVPLHQGLVKLLYQSAKDKGGASRGQKGGFPRSNGTPISRAQLLLGAAPLGKESPVSKPRVVLSKSKEEKDSPRKEISKDSSKGGNVGSLKRKPPPKFWLLAWLSVEDKDRTDEDKDAETGKGVEESVPETLPRRGSSMEPQGTFIVLEELRCHMKILNGLGGPLTSTCACINLLALEITNYLKEVVNKLKEMGSAEF